MKKYLKCKVCGFIGEEGEITKGCPACGVPVSAFESYQYDINEKRLNLLNMHIHPVLVHFPQSIAFLSLIFIIIAFTTQGQISSNLIIVEKLLSIILPISALIATVAGMFDARTRFKKKFGPLLKQKIVLSAIFFLSTSITAVLINYEAFNFWGKVAIIILSIGSFLCSGLLGKKGAKLLDSKLRG